MEYFRDAVKAAGIDIPFVTMANSAAIMDRWITERLNHRFDIVRAEAPQGPDPHDPTPDDINAYNDYNTYFIMGLPPTPINSPSLACMQAVCAPPETDYFYFYFEPDASGKMAYSFSATYEEHQQTYQ